jgi:deoxyribose-phosphate aldolase
VVNAARRALPSKILVKVILETSLLTKEEQQTGCQLAEKAEADFVKTSTGFTGSGVTIEDVAVLRRAVGERLGIKAAGGIRDLVTAIALINAGATRLGCSSSVPIMNMWPV